MSDYSVVFVTKDYGIFAQPSYAYPIYGKTSLEYLQETFSAHTTADAPITVYLDASFPNVTRQTVETLVEALKRENWPALRFSVGKVVRAGERELELRYAECDCGLGLTCLENVPRVREALRTRIVREHIRNGVEIEDESAVHIDATARLEAGAFVAAYSRITGRSVVECGARIESFCMLSDSFVGKNARIVASVLDHASVGEGCVVGPYAHLYANTALGAACHVGSGAVLADVSAGRGAHIPPNCCMEHMALDEHCRIGSGTVLAPQSVADGMGTGSERVRPFVYAEGQVCSGEKGKQG